jgi:hypothetical protein
MIKKELMSLWIEEVRKLIQFLGGLFQIEYINRSNHAKNQNQGFRRGDSDLCTAAHPYVTGLDKNRRLLGKVPVVLPANLDSQGLVF